MAEPHSHPMLKSLLRSTTAIAAALMFGALCAAPAHAQVEEDPDDVIVVTGTRIPRPANAEAPTQVTTIGEAEIEQSGLTNVADILRTVPSFGVPALSTTNSNFLTSGAGINTLQLRNLGEDRTLVLVNGRRHVAGIPGSAAVDFNTIPVQMIERVEVITGGASAIYGSDALAGVINVILQDDFQGLEAGYQYGITDAGDNETHTPYVMWGVDMDQGRGNLTVLVSHDRQSGVFARDRDNTRIDDIATCALTGIPADCTTPFQPFFSSFSEYGRFNIPSTGEAFTVGTGVGPGGTVVPFTSADYGFNRQQFRIISVPTERWLFSGNAHYDFTPNIEGFAEATFARTDTESELEPYPLAFDDLPITGISITNPFVPPDIAAAAAAAGDTEVEFARRLTEIGNRGTTGEREMIQVVTGLRGDLAERFNWELFYSFGQTDQWEESGGSVNVNNFANALNAVDLDGNPATTDDIVCADPAAVAAGCVPINIFGLGSISPAAADYVRIPTSRRSQVRQEIAGFTIGGPAFTLPAGDLDFAGGIEWRKESASDVPDPLTQAGIAAGNQEFPIDGSYDVLEGFVEVEAPLIRDRAFVHELSVGGAYRISDYSTVGTTHAYTGRISWAPIEPLRFRAQYARAVRAPNIGELFAPGGENFAPVSDPCAGVTAVDDPTTVVDDNCRSIPAIAARIAATGSFTLTQPEIQGTGGFTGAGNPNLDSETADSFNVGIVYNQDFGNMGRVLFSIDYYQIEIDDLIDTIDRQQAVDLCFNSATFPNPFCDNLVRDTTGAAFQQGELIEVNSGFINEGSLETSGIDLSVNYAVALEDLIGRPWGEVTLRMNYAHLLEFTQTKFNVSDSSEGEVGFSENKVQGAISYRYGPWSATWETTYLSDATPDSDPGSPFAYDVGSFTTHDLQVGWDVTENANLYFGVNNVFDEDPPTILSGVPGNTTGTDTAADVYDPLGRAFYVGARLRLN
jgi:iron complex outermembrane recepter protein